MKLVVEFFSFFPKGKKKYQNMQNGAESDSIAKDFLWLIRMEMKNIEKLC